MNILIKNAKVITFDESNPFIERCNVIVSGDKIKNITSDNKLPEGDYDVVIDGSYKVLMPSYVNAHTHFYSSFAKGITGISSSDNFVEVLENMWWRLDKKLTLEDVYYSALVAMIDGVKKGVTSFIDHHASPFAITGSLSEIKKASEHVGIKSCLAYEVSDRDGQAICQEGIKENVDFSNLCISKNVKSLFGLHASFTLNNNTLKDIIKANSNNIGYHIHVSEDLADEEDSQSKYGMSVVKRLLDHGMLNENTILGHCTHVSDEDMDIIAKYKAKVVHNPQSNANNAVGIANITKMINKGLLVGLGTDAMTNSMGQEVRTSLWLQHLINKNPSIGFGEVASTLYSNNYVIANNIWKEYTLGKVKEGYQADLILLDYDPITPLNATNYYGHLIFGLAEANVSTTISNGEILWHNNKLTDRLNEKDINKRSRELAQKLWERL